MTLAGLALLAAAPVILPGAQGRDVEQQVKILAESIARSALRFEDAIYSDPAMRAELRRVGFPVGCKAVADSSRTVVPVYAPRIEPFAAQAIRDLIPAEQFAQARVVSFLTLPFNIYRGRVAEAVDRAAAIEIASGRAALKSAFLERTRKLPTAATDGMPQPRADLSAALGLNGRWNTDNASHLALACVEQRMDPSIRPRFSTPSSTKVQIISPKGQTQ